MRRGRRLGVEEAHGRFGAVGARRSSVVEEDSRRNQDEFRRTGRAVEQIDTRGRTRGIELEHRGEAPRGVGDERSGLQLRTVRSGS